MLVSVHGFASLSSDCILPPVPGEVPLLWTVDLVFFDVGCATERSLERVNRLDNDEIHESRTTLRRAQWNVNMNKPCRLTPTVNTTYNDKDTPSYIYKVQLLSYTGKDDDLDDNIRNISI